MFGRRVLIFGSFFVSCLIAGVAHAAPPSGKSVETEKIIGAPDTFSIGEPGLTIPDLPDLDEDEVSDEANPPGNDGNGPGFTIDNGDMFGPPPAVEYDVSKLPPPVRRLRDQLIEAAKTGDIENLRPIFEANQELPLISFDAVDDPIDQLKSLAGDPEGREILAILIEVLDAGFVHVDIDTPEEMFIWPYFARYPLDDLNGRQMVELFKLLTAGDFEDMKIFGAYIFYRVGIAPNGVWKYFVAGD